MQTKPLASDGPSLAVLALVLQRCVHVALNEARQRSVGLLGVSSLSRAWVSLECKVVRACTEPMPQLRREASRL